jgi:hypothetical protein
MGLLRMAARTAVVAGTATAVSGRVARRQARKYDQPAEEEQQEQAPLPQQEPAAEAAPQDDTVNQIQEMAKLHTAGVISDAEFTAAKAKILGI